MNFVDIDTALSASGLRILVTAGIPSPWSQAALAVLRVKQLPMRVARTRALDPAFQHWRGAINLPAVLMDDEPVRTGWAEILALAERLAPAMPLLPGTARERSQVMGLCHEIMSEGALLWCTRLLAIEAGLASEGREGFPLPAAQYLAKRYCGTGSSIISARTRALEVLALLDSTLLQSTGPFYAGQQLTALDLYSATAMNALMPLPEAECPMNPAFRAAFSWMGQTLGNALTPALLTHRDHVVAHYFDLPIKL